MSDDNSALETMRQVFALAGQGRLSYEDLKTVANILVSAGNYPVAAQLYREWLSHTNSPLAPNVWCDLGDALLAAREPAQALQAFQRALELFPNHPRARAGLDKCR